MVTRSKPKYCVHLHTLRREASKHFREKEDLNTKVDELEANTNIENIRDFCRGFSEFKKGKQPRTNMMRSWI